MNPGRAKSGEGQELRTLLASRIGAMVVPTGPDEARVMDMLENAAAEQELPVWTWTVTKGLSAKGRSGQTNTGNPAGALAFIRDQNRPGVFVFLDAQPLLDDAVATRLLKELAMARMRGRTIVLAGLAGDLPPGLQGVVVRWNPGLPGREELRQLARTTAIGLANSGLHINLTRSQAEALVDSLLGLSRAQSERLIVQHTVADGRLDANDIPAIRAAKAELLSADSPLDLIPVDVNLNDVGGLESLKQWLRQRGRGFEPAAREFGLPAPRGVLLTGVPGTGKSLISKAIAGSWGMALIALDTGRLHGSYVGQSEANIDRALDAVQTMAPAVLWIDEIEKIFGQSGESDGGAANRVLGVLLRWMQERPDGVFVVATSNDINKLPPS